MRARVAVAFLTVFISASPALADSSSAQTPAANPAASPEIKRLMDYVNTQAYFDNISTVVLGGERDITPECKGAKVIGRVGFGVLALPQFKEGSDVPAAGAWKDRIKVDRCGSPVIHNVLVDVEPDGPHVGLLLPGDTDLPLPLQIKGLQTAAEAVVRVSGCKDPNRLIVADTHHDKVLAPVKADDHGLLTAGKWQEVWTFRACGKDQRVAMVFTADGKGSATFKATPAK